MYKKRTIIVAGAGIAGLSAALLLANNGFRIIVLERSGNIDQAGVGIQLSPNATHILDKLGLTRQLAAAAFAPKNIIIKKGASGRVLSVFPLGDDMVDRYGAPYLVLHRADLANLLLNACDDHPDINVYFDATLEDAAMHANGITVMAMNSGKMVEYLGIALIGADGGRSNVRSRIIGSDGAVSSGDIAWRTLIPIEQVPKGISKLDTTLWMGKSGHIVSYPVRGSRHFNVVAITPQSCASHITHRTHETGGGKLLKFFCKWDTDIIQLLGSTSHWQGWPLNQINPAGSWVRGSTVLIGDAAHAMLPYAAQGGAAAIEDAAMLAACVSKSSNDLPAAFSNYEKLRKPRATKIWQLARKNQKIYHLSGPSAGVRNIVLNNTSVESLYKRFDWLYGWKIQDFVKA